MWARTPAVGSYTLLLHREHPAVLKEKESQLKVAGSGMVMSVVQGSCHVQVPYE